MLFASPPGSRRRWITGIVVAAAIAGYSGCLQRRPGARGRAARHGSDHIVRRRGVVHLAGLQ